MIAMSTGQPLREISPEVIMKEQDFVNKYLGITAQSHLNSFIRMYAKTCPEFENYDFTRGLKWINVVWSSPQRDFWITLFAYWGYAAKMGPICHA